MSMFEEGLKVVEETFGHGKDNLIAVATIARQPGAEGEPRPVVRTVDAIYADGTFYIVTHAKSNKMLQIAENPEVSVAGVQDMFTASGRGENLGWVLDPRNAEIRAKLRAAFAQWYDSANNERDTGCCIMAIHLSKGTMNVNHWEKLYYLDFANKTTMPDGGVY